MIKKLNFRSLSVKNTVLNYKKGVDNMTFKELRALSGMSQRKFATYFGIPRRTVEDWERELGHCATYLLDLMKYKLENEGIIPREETEQ